MALWDDEPSNGTFTAIVKFDARSGRMKRVERGPNGNEEIDITRTFKAVIDMENIEIGWSKFAAGMAPSWVMVPRGNPFPPKPEEEEYRRSFRTYLKLSKECGGDIRELGGSSKALLDGFNAVHDRYLAEKTNHPGKLPVVELGEPREVITETKKGKNTNYAPDFKIIGWAARPEGLGVTAKAAPAPAPARAAPPSTGSSRATPPPVVEVDEDDFG